MDQLFNAGKQFLDNQQHNNSNDNNQGNNGGGGGGGFDIGDIQNLVGHAQNHDSDQDSGLLSQAASFLKNNQGSIASNGNDLDENQMMQHANKANNTSEQMHSSEIGSAAALNAVKSVLGGGGSSGSGGGGDMQSKLIGAAMAQAGKMFSQKQSNGQVSGGSQQDAMQSAGEAMMKLMIKNKMSGMIGGGQSGGLGSLMNLIN